VFRRWPGAEKPRVRRTGVPPDFQFTPLGTGDIDFPGQAPGR
jgi:hypothetical protein